MPGIERTPTYPQDWKSGEKVRVVKVMAPFGGGEEFAKETLTALGLSSIT
jgi:hemolysin-activating ACP:hemolysin acyltransferase